MELFLGYRFCSFSFSSMRHNGILLVHPTTARSHNAYINIYWFLGEFHPTKLLQLLLNTFVVCHLYCNRLFCELKFVKNLLKSAYKTTRFEGIGDQFSVDYEWEEMLSRFSTLL